MWEINTKVVGVTFRNEDGSHRQDCISGLFSGDRLALVPNPDNRHDPKAVKVWCGREQIGHLSRSAAVEVTDHLDEGGTAFAQVLEVTGGTAEKPTLGVNIRVFLEETPRHSHSHRGVSRDFLGALIAIGVIVLLVAYC